MSRWKKFFGVSGKRLSQDELISVITHQFRTPLSNIKWTLSAFLSGDQGQLTDEQEKLLTRASDSTERLLRFVDDLMKAHKIEAGKLETEKSYVNLFVVVQNVIADLSLQAEEKSVDVQLEGNVSEVPEVYADPYHLRVMAQTLIENALQYSKQHGTVRVKVTADKQCVHLEVEDNGIGIPLESQKFIYSRLYRADNAIATDPNGSGLGLYINKMLVNQYGGNINFTSTEKVGTLFTIDLPIKKKH